MTIDAKGGNPNCVEPMSFGAKGPDSLALLTFNRFRYDK